jgi:ElaB/YqjD/DUF883 family membrane-anchored ribosome-binding protein
MNSKPRTVTQNLRELGGMARDIAEEKVDQLRTSATEAYQGGRNSMQRGGHYVEQFIREQPFKSILVAAGVGMLLGGLWMRR